MTTVGAHLLCLRPPGLHGARRAYARVCARWSTGWRGRGSAVPGRERVCPKTAPSRAQTADVFPPALGRQTPSPPPPPHPFLSPVPTSTVNMSWSGCARPPRPPHTPLTPPQIQEVHEQGGHNRTLPAPPPSPSPTPTPHLTTTLLPPPDPAKDRPDRAHGRPGLRHRGGEIQTVRPASSHSRRTLPLRYPCRRSRSPASLRA